jgi:glycerol-3-phosphate dehydrogenase
MPESSRVVADPASRLGAIDRSFDLLVIGGGVTGCGIAREATMRGLSVVLIEKDDFASGTSSRSSRLVHGGVRYLEHGHLKLVFEASAERRRLLRLAPHLVRPLRFTWPVYRGARMPRWKLLAGLTLYDALALFRNVGRHRRLSALEVTGLQPTLKTDGLVGGATYYDAATDDCRLTLAVALDARDRGATLVNHARVTSLTIENGRTTGADVSDDLTGTTARIRARVVVNATGPWSDEVRALEDVQAQKKVQGSKGVHICVDRSRLDNHDALTLLSPDDGRVMFVLPAGELTIIGTTDTFTDVSPDAIRASEGDVRYLLDAANWFFPAAKLTAGDVVAAWAGIRPLAAATAAGSSVSASREHAITVTPTGVVTITGGKLTTFRVMAAETVEVALKQLHRDAPPSRSEGAPIAWDLSATVDGVVGDAQSASGDAELAAHLVASYGSRWRDVWASIRDEPGGTERVAANAPVRMGELRYSCRSEMACGLADLLIRRTRLAYQLRDHGQSIAEAVARYVAPTLGWPAQDVAAHVACYRAEVDRIFSIDR